MIFSIENIPNICSFIDLCVSRTDPPNTRYVGVLLKRIAYRRHGDARVIHIDDEINYGKQELKVSEYIIACQH